MRNKDFDRGYDIGYWYGVFIGCGVASFILFGRFSSWLYGTYSLLTFFNIGFLIIIFARIRELRK